MEQSNLVSTSSVALAVAWRKYLQTGEINVKVIKPTVAASWQRSQEAHVDPLGGECHHVLGSSELRHIQESLMTLTMTHAHMTIKKNGRTGIK